MLVLGISLEEIIKIGDDIELTFMREKTRSLAKGGVRICIKAPKSLLIERIQKEGKNGNNR